MALTIGYAGNFRPDHSTENEIRKALTALGHEAIPLQEDTAETWTDSPLDRIDLWLWTRTGWDWPHTAAEWSWEEACDRQRDVLADLRKRGITSCGVHLDRWHGLDREGQIDTEPFFEVDVLATADGGHDAEWIERGITHWWFPPGVSEFECGGGTYNRRLASDVAFVGSWRPGYHKEWQHRPQLVDFLRTTYRQRCRFWGGPGRSMRGAALRDLYASTKVNVGDSCLVGNATAYCSDRLPECIGRGGFLLHPHVQGVTDGTLYTDGVHLRCWTLGDWDELRRLIDYYVTHDDERRQIAAQGRAHVLERHTYTTRMRDLLADLHAEGLVPDPG